MIKKLLHKQIASSVVAVFTAATLYAQTSTFQTQFSGNDDSSLRDTYNYTGPLTDTSGEYAKIHAVGGGKVTFTFDDAAIFGSSTVAEENIAKIVGECEGLRVEQIYTPGLHTLEFDIASPSSPKEILLEVEVLTKADDEGHVSSFNTEFNTLHLYPTPSHSEVPHFMLSIGENQGISDLTYSMPTISGGTGSWQFECNDHSNFAQCYFTDGILHIDGTAPNVAGDAKKIDEYNFNIRYFCADPVNKDASKPWLSGTFENIATLYVYNSPDIIPQLAVYHFGNSTYSYVTNTGMTDSELAAKEYLFSFDRAASLSSSREFSGNARSVRAVWVYNQNGTEYRAESATANVSNEYTISNSFTYELEKGGSQPAQYQPVLVGQTWHGWINDVVKFNYQPNTDGLAALTAKYYLGSNEVASGAALTSPAQLDAHAVFSAQIPVETNYNIERSFSSVIIDPAIRIYDPAIAPTIAESGDRKTLDNETATLNFKANEGNGSNGNWKYSWTRRMLANGDVNDIIVEMPLSIAEPSLSSDNNIAIDGERKQTATYDYILHYSNIAPDGTTVWAEGDLNMGSLTVYNVPKAPTRLKQYQIGENAISVMDFDNPETPYDLYSFTDNRTNDFTNNKPYYENIANPLMEGQVMWIYSDNTVAASRVTSFKEANDKFTASAKIEIRDVNYTGTTNGFSFTGAQNYNNRWYGLVGSDIQLSTSFAPIDIQGRSYTLVNGTEVDALQLYHPTAAGNYAYTYNLAYSIPLSDGSVYEAEPLVSEPANLTLYDVPTVPTAIRHSGSLQLTESKAPALSMTVDNPAGAKSDGWILQWAVNGNNIAGETSNSYIYAQKREVSGHAKKIDEYAFSISFANVGPDGSNWITGNVELADRLKVYNEPLAIGNVTGYQTDESNFQYIACNLGLTDEHLTDYDFYYDGLKNADGRYLPQNVRPSQMWTQFAYDDGFTTVSARTAADAQPLSPSVRLEVSADGSGLAAPIVNGVATEPSGFHHCLPGTRITLNTTSSLDRATKISSAYSVNGNPFDGTYTVPESEAETDATFHDMMTFRIEVDSENGTVVTKDLTFKSADRHLAKFYPTPVYPTLESTNGNQKYRDIDQTNYALTTTAPSGANASGWKLQWMRDDTELAGQTDSQYTDTQVYDIPEDSKIKKDIKFGMAFANLAPAGDFNWIEGNVSVPGLSIYNTPTKPERIVTVKYGNRVETFPTGIGVTDDEAAQKEYLFSFDGRTAQTSRYFDGDASRVASVWNYDDFVCSSDETSRTADGFSELSISDLSTSANMAISGTISDSSTFTATYTGPVEDAGNSTYYAISGYDNINNSALANLTNGDANKIALVTKTSVIRDYNHVEQIDGLTYSATNVDPGVYTFENIAELTVAVENNQQHQLSYSVPGTHTINLLVPPVFPKPKANADSYFFDDTEVVNLNASIESAANGNPTGWSTKWIVDNREVGQDEALRYPIESDNKTVETHEVTFSFANKAPVGDTNWIEGENTSFPPIVVFNVPEQPAGIGHFFDEGSRTDSYFAMNTGLADDQLSNRKYQFCFNDGNNEIINSVDEGRYFDAGQNGLRPTSVSSVWVYSTAQGDGYDYTTKNRSSINGVDEYSFTYNPKLEINRGDNTDEAVFPVIEVSVDGLRQALSGVSLTYTPSAEETNGKALSNFANTVKLSTGSSNADYEDNTFSLIASTAGLYTLEQNVTAEITVDNGQNYSISGIDTSCDRVRIWECPAIETPAVADLGNWRDIDSPDLGSSGLTVNQPAGGNSSGWQYSWNRSDIGNIGNGLTLANDGNSVNDASESMNSEVYTYSVRYTNISPDEKTAWYTRTVDIAKATVYNTPRQPGRFVFFNSNGAGDDKYIVKDLGLSDEQIDNLDYLFTDNSGNILTSGSRYIAGGTPINSVRSLWKYEDGYNALSDATSIESEELTASFAPNINVEKGANDNAAYIGAIRDNLGQFHALEGSDIRFEIELRNSDFDLSDTALKISDNNGNESEITPTTHGNKAAFVYRMTDVATYSVSGDIDARYLVDSYNNDGLTIPVYADLKSKTDLSGFKVRTYPTPTLSAPVTGVSSSYKYRSIDNDIKQLSITSAAGGNESWNYTWLKDDVEISGTGLSADVDKISFNGNGKEMKSTKYSVRVTDANPVNGQPWYDYTYDVSTVDFYNTPNRPAKLINYVNNGNSTAFAAGVGFNDADLNALEYEFIFDGTNNGSKRGFGNKASEVRTSWKYNDGFVCSSEPTTLTETIEPQISASVSITDASYEGYTGSVKDSGENERYYSLPGAVGRYTFNITGKDLSVKGNAIAFKFENGNTPSQAQQYRTDFNETGIYDGQISATMVYNAETDQTIDLAAEFGLPTSALVEVLPAPAYPEIGTYANQFRDEDAEFVLEPRTLPSGANHDGWSYSWTEGTNNYGNEGSAIIDIPDMNADQMQAVKRNITMQYSNSAPNGQKWITGSLDFEAYIYNTPKQPATLTPKGNGTSNIYIVTNMGDNDDTLKAKHYQFAFGDGSTPTPESSEVVDIEGRRWYKYGSSPSDPWVYSLWKYAAADGIPAYDCYSDATRIGEGSRSDISLRDLYAVDDEEISIFTAGGVRIDLDQTKKLSPGVYVVVHGTGDDTYSEKIVVK